MAIFIQLNLKKTNKNNIIRGLFHYSIICLILTIFSCTKTTEHIYYEDIECSSGQYVIKESSIDFQKYIKDSLNYQIEIKKENDFNQKSFFMIDSMLNTKNYISKNEKKLLQQTKQRTEYVKGKWGREYSINYIFNFKNQKELNSFRVAYTKWKCAIMIPVLEIYAKNEPKYKGVLDTLKNGKLMKKLIVENNNILKFKKNKLLYYTPNKTLNLNKTDSINITFPKPIKNITNYNVRHKLSEDKTILVLYYSIEQTRNKMLINF